MAGADDEERPPEAVRLEEARVARGFETARAAADYFGWPYSTYSQHERGERGLTKKAASRYANAYRTTAGYLLTGEGRRDAEPMVPIVGQVRAGAEMVRYGDGQGPFSEVPMPPNGTQQTVAVEVRGSSMGGRIEDGDIVYYDDVRDPPTDDLIGKLCVIQLHDGRAVVKYLERKGTLPGLFHLTSPSAETMWDVPVAWAAKVIAITPR